MNCNKECVFLMNNENKWTDNNIGDEGANKISESLMINTTLTQLELWGNWNSVTKRNDFDTFLFVYREQNQWWNQESIGYIMM